MERKSILSNKEIFMQLMELSELEMIFKKMYEKYPQRSLHLPHSAEECSDILESAAQELEEPLPEQLAGDRILSEDKFFRSCFDTEIYQHLRYLPAAWHAHSFFEAACVIHGSCINYIFEQKLEMQAGDVCIIAPETTHAVSAFSDDCMMFNICMRTSTFEKAFFGVLTENDILSEFFMRTLYHSNTHPYLLFRTGGDRELFDFALYAYQESLSRKRYRERLLNNVVSAFFIILLRNHESNVIIPQLAAQGQDANIIFLLKYMQENYCTVTLKELAEFFHYSERQVQRIIKSSTGMSFSQNIQKLKMLQAARLLRNSDLPVSVIAENLGYMDSGNFRYTFKKYYGLTPTEYRGDLK